MLEIDEELTREQLSEKDWLNVVLVGVVVGNVDGILFSLTDGLVDRM